MSGVWVNGLNPPPPLHALLLLKKNIFI